MFSIKFRKDQHIVHYRTFPIYYDNDEKENQTFTGDKKLFIVYYVIAHIPKLPKTLKLNFAKNELFLNGNLLERVEVENNFYKTGF